MHGVYGRGEFDVLGAIAVLERRAHDAGDIGVVECQRYLAALRLLRHALQRGPADELMVELHERPVAQVPRVQVVAVNGGGHVAATDGGLGFVAVRAQPVAVILQRIAGVDGRQRRGNPAAFDGVRRIRTTADEREAEVATRFDECLTHGFAVRPRAEQFEARLAGHAVAKCAHFAAADGEVRHVEELQVGRGVAQRLFHDLHRVRALDLVAVVLAVFRVLADGGALVTLHLHVPLATGSVVFHPLDGGRAADEVEAVFFEVEEDDVADDVSVRCARHELLGAVRDEAGEAVHAEVVQHGEGVGAGHFQVDHVVRLVEQHAGLLPGALFQAPVGVFRGHARVNVGAYLLVAQEIDHVAAVGEDFVQVLAGH